MSPDLAERVRKIIPRLGSSHAGEVIASAAAVGRLLAAERMGWCDLAEHLVPALPPPGSGSTWAPPPEEEEDRAALTVWAATVSRCLRAGAALKLPSRDYNFLHGLLWQIENRRKPPSIKQRTWLAALAERLGVV